MDRKRQKLTPGKVNESNDDALDINSLPNEIILNVFGYLEQNQLGHIARVCSRWNVLTKCPVLWKKVNVKFFPSATSEMITVKSFIDRLPSCVTSIRFDFMEYDDYCWIATLDFEELCVQLQEKCPHLKELRLTNADLSHSLPSVIDICSQLLIDVKNLVLHYCIYPDYSEKGKFCGTSKIEVLDLSWCQFGRFNNLQFSRMPCLKVLSLSGTNVDDSWFTGDISFLKQLHVLNLGHAKITRETFQAIQNHGLNLKELYLCSCALEHCEITLNNSENPHLKTICLVGNWVTSEGIVSLVQSCPTLENVFVHDRVTGSFEAHPFVVANKCKSEIVKHKSWYHNHRVVLHY